MCKYCNEIVRLASTLQRLESYKQPAFVNEFGKQPALKAARFKDIYFINPENCKINKRSRVVITRKTRLGSDHESDCSE